MTDAQRLTLVRAIHTAIYAVMAVSTFVLLYAGLTGCGGMLLWVAMALLGVEVVVFAGSGMKCPLTALAVRYGAETGHVFDTFFLCYPQSPAILIRLSWLFSKLPRLFGN